uniref:Uncharacterized protein n=1 Tax=Rousettus aegyptiacus TaxID=9407 RepID=A0A7J8KB89_ROUAE|nr:hypothetical protein HJG63_007953 [Rousettus aegyptiacus]
MTLLSTWLRADVPHYKVPKPPGQSPTALATAQGRGWGHTVRLLGRKGIFSIDSLWGFATALAAGDIGRRVHCATLQGQAGGGGPEVRAEGGGPQVQAGWGSGWLFGLLTGWLIVVGQGRTVAVGGGLCTREWPYSDSVVLHLWGFVTQN